MSTPSTWDSIIGQFSGIYNVPVALVKAIMSVESGGNPYAKNPDSSASGLMQVIHGTWDYVANTFNIATDWTKDRFDPTKNIQVGTAYLGQQLNRYNGDIPSAIAAYYSGTPNGSPAEQAYVDKVLSHYQQYSDKPGVISSPFSTSPVDNTGGGNTGGGVGTWFWVGLGLIGFLVLRRSL